MSEPADYLVPDEDIELNSGRRTVLVRVRNTGDRPIQVGSHYHFFEVNAALEFDRASAYGMRLDVPAGLAVRFEPGDEREVTLVAYGGERIAIGFAGLVDGALDDQQSALARVRERGFLSSLPLGDPSSSSLPLGEGQGEGP